MYRVRHALRPSPRRIAASRPQFARHLYRRHSPRPPQSCMQRLAGNAAVARALGVARSARPAGMLVPEEDVSRALPAPGTQEAALPQGAARGDRATLDETMVQRTIGDGHDLSNPSFAGDPVLEACFDNERTLKQGSQGPAVIKVQQALVDLGFPLPRFGVDGDFGAETKQSLQAFQRSATLSDDGIVGPNTMAQLDQRAPGGGGGGGDGPIPPPTCTVTTATVAQAPDASANTRTRVGPGELVDLPATGNSFWVPTSRNGVGAIRPDYPMDRSRGGWRGTITAVDATTGASCATTFTVVPPDSISMTRASVDPIPAGQAGAGMLCEVDFDHTDVSFSRVEWLEVPGPPAVSSATSQGTGKQRAWISTTTPTRTSSRSKRTTTSASTIVRAVSAAAPVLVRWLVLVDPEPLQGRRFRHAGNNLHDHDPELLHRSLWDSERQQDGGKHHPHPGWRRPVETRSSMVPVAVHLTALPRTSRDGKTMIMVTGRVGNLTGSPIDTRVYMSDLLIDGVPWPSWSLVIGNGTIDARLVELPPGEEASFSRAAGRLVASGRSACAGLEGARSRIESCSDMNARTPLLQPAH